MRQWQFLRLDGSCSVKQRQALVDQFNDPGHPSFLFLVSSKAGGVGLNIIGERHATAVQFHIKTTCATMIKVWCNIRRPVSSMPAGHD